MQKDKKILFYLYYFVIFFSTAIYTSFLNLHLNSLGVPSSTIGVVNGVSRALTLVALPYWGRFADRAPSVNIVLIIAQVSSIVLMLVFQQSRTVFMLCFMLILFTVFYNPITSLYETIGVSSASLNGWDYSPIRMSGTLGYALMSYLSGNVLSKNQDLIFPVFIGSMLLATGIAVFLPTISIRKDAGETKQTAKGSAFSLLKDPHILSVMLLLMAYAMGSAFNSTYFGIFMMELGGDYRLVGISHMLLALSELPFHLGPGRRFLKKIGVERSLQLGISVGVLRWIIVGTCKSPVVLCLSMLFNGIMLVPTIVGLVEYINQVAPPHLRASAQSGLRATFQVVGQLTATILGGSLIGLFDRLGLEGIRYMYLALSPIFLLFVLFSVLSTKGRAPKAGDQT